MQARRRRWRIGTLLVAATAMGIAAHAQPCAATNVPYTENFNAVTTPDLPTCMSLETVSGNPWTTVAAPTGYTGNVARVSYTLAGSPDMDSWLFTQGLNLTGGTSYRLSYTYGNNSSATYTERMAVSYGLSNNEASMVNFLADHTAINDAVPHNSTVDFTPAADGVYYIGFKCYSIADQYYLYLDNIKVMATPTCEAPPAVTMDSFSISDCAFSWTASISNPANGYEWELRDANAPGSGTDGLVESGTTLAGELSASAHNLVSNTTYFVYVRANCGGGDFSEWTEPTSFTTPCDAQNIPYLENFEEVTVPALPNCMSDQTLLGPDWTTVSNGPAGMNGQMARCYGYEPVNSWLYTAGLNLSGGVSYRLTYRYSNQYNFYVDAMKVAYGTDPENTAMAHTLIDHPAINDGAVHTDTIEFTPAADGVYYIGFQKYSNDGTNDAYLYIDDIRVVVTPSCEEPTALSTGDMTTATATISWTASATNPADGYEWEVRTSGAAGSGTTGLVSSGSTAAGEISAGATGLDPNTTYSLYVRSICSSSDQSTWAGPYVFTTPCTATDVPYTEDFNAVTTPAIPNCMSLQTVSGNPWRTVTAPGGMTGNAANVTYTASGSPDMNSWLFTQGLNLTGGTTYRLTYKYFNNSTTYTERMAVAYGSSNDAAAMANALADHSAIQTTTVQTNQVDFTPAADGVFYIGFKCYSIADQNQLYLDDINVVALNGCTGTPDPGATTGPASICPGTSFTLALQNPPTEGGLSFQWEVSTDGNDWTNAAGNSTGSTYTTTQTDGHWYRVQVTCANGGTASSTPLQVTMNDFSGCYCIPVMTTGCSYPDVVTNVNIAGINRTSQCDNTSGANGYSFFATPVGTLAAGSASNAYSVSIAGDTEGAAAWIDFNHDGQFTADEQIFSGLSQTTPYTYTGNFSVPANALLGTTGMRVRCMYNHQPAATEACTGANYGETEDYLVNITAQGSVDCLGVPGGPALPGTACTASTGFGGTWSAQCICVENVGIAESAAQQGVAVHPNPASTELFITTQGAQPVHVKVYDMVGKLALEQDKTTRISVANLAPGSYTLLITDEKGSVQGRTRFVKQ